MPRVAIAVNDMPAYGAGLDSLTWTDADATNNHEFVNDGKTLLLVRNRNAAGRTATIVSVADPLSGRTGDKVRTVAATTGQSVAGPFEPRIWNQSDGKVQVNVSASASSSDYQLAAVRIP